MFRKAILTATVTACCLSGVAFADVPVKVAETDKGKVLVDTKGMTLYTFSKDTSGKSVCNGPCATNWPPLPVSADAKADHDYSVVTRDDGSKQWAYKGMPLYSWVKDSKPGDTTGDGVNQVWHVAKP